MTSAEHEEELHAYLDGELSEAEYARVERELMASEEDRATLLAFGQLGELLRKEAAEASTDLPTEDLYARVRAQIDEDKRLGRGYMQVIPGGKGRSFTTVGVVLAIAAAAALGFFARDGFSAGSGHTVIADGTRDGGAPHPVAVLEEPTQGSEVVEVDFGGNAGTVFAVPGSAGQPLAVVWIEDEKPSL